MSAAPALAVRDEVHGQWSGYWLEPGSSTPVVRLLRREPGWRLAIWDAHGAVRVYEAETAESISQADVARLYGAEPAERARPDRLTVQLQLRVTTG